MTKAQAQSSTDYCAETGFQHCAGFGPSFCCPQDSVCVALAAKTTLLCCPVGRSCDVIRPITCDVREQDPARNPRAPLKTALLGQELPAGQVISAPLLNQASSSTASSYRTDFLRPKQQPSSSSTLSPWTFPTTPPPPPPHPAVNNNNNNNNNTSTTSSFIPNPFSSPNGLGLTGAVPAGPLPRSPSGNPARSSITSLEEMTARTGHVAGSRLAPIRTMKPSYFRRSRHLRHQQSSESIDVFADADVAPVLQPATTTTTANAAGFRHDPNRDTSLTAMMEQAGLGDLRRGRPYVPGTTPRI
ncbi:hypothetical protein L249_3626 [Ophiocordyceps polyrhachis-furcata BCC 54312]|uniref:Uncharacterized protein n=1 Tax=Ophiocordyceps polyrhachis-furcata BCC 54312 TaxID=1330021 RepID=A0A367LMG3_9HYPO|nr:hypothetical protein L249_3626 [Ophiocordyceps polyrhachis-furcata BCC 54312]